MERKPRVEQISAQVSVLCWWAAVCGRGISSLWCLNGRNGGYPSKSIWGIQWKDVKKCISVGWGSHFSTRACEYLRPASPAKRDLARANTSCSLSPTHPTAHDLSSIERSRWSHSLVLCVAAGSTEPAEGGKQQERIVSQSGITVVCDLFLLCSLARDSITCFCNPFHKAFFLL